MNIVVATLVFAGLVHGQQDAIASKDLMPRIAKVAHQSAAHDVGRFFASGPILVDVESFQASARKLGFEAVNERTLLDAVGPKSRPASADEAVVCTYDARRTPRKCQIEDDGLFIKVDSIKVTESGFDAFVTLMWTERRSSVSSATGIQTRIISFARATHGWRLVRNEVYRGS